jgi:hypothetical protein
VLATLISAGACSDAGSPSGTGQINFNLATKAAASPAAAGAVSVAVGGTPETYSDGTNTLVIDRVQLVLREIELKRSEATTDCSATLDHDACERLELGPILLDLPLGGAGGAARSFSVEVAPGSYSEVEFEIHTPRHDDDAAFVQANPDFEGVSIKVTGSYNGAPFSFVSDLEAEEEIELNPALVTSEGAADLTLFVDLDRWFRDGTGALLDPLTANAGGPNERLVEGHIQSTLHAFEDENEDGTDDHRGHGSDD